MSTGGIVVIGAGLAGLTAAYRLTQKGYDVAVYEARARVGGRVHTALIKNAQGAYSNAELGAQNITDGGECAYILALIKEFNLELSESYFPIEGVFFDGATFLSTQKLLSQIVEANENILLSINQLAQSSQSMQEVLDQLILNTAQKSFLMFVLNAYEGLSPSLQSTNSHNLNTLSHLLTGGLSATHAISKETPLFHRMSLKDGNAKLPQSLAKHLKNPIHFNKVLEKISLHADNQYLLTFADDAPIVCHRLILAIPCPIYKDISFDSSIIDDEKLKKMRAIHFGATTKTLMPIQHHIANGHWVSSHNMGLFFNDDQQLLNLYFINDDGKNTFDVKLMTEGFACSTLNTLPVVEAKDTQYEKYDSPVAKCWIKDPFAKGSYSGFDISQTDIDERVDYKGIQMKALFAPINNRLFFVGEHTTILDEIGTMEAAVESGERIATAIATQ